MLHSSTAYSHLKACTCEKAPALWGVLPQKIIRVHIWKNVSSPAAFTCNTRVEECSSVYIYTATVKLKRLQSTTTLLFKRQKLYRLQWDRRQRNYTALITDCFAIKTLKQCEHKNKTGVEDFILQCSIKPVHWNLCIMVTSFWPHCTQHKRSNVHSTASL